VLAEPRPRWVVAALVGASAGRTWVAQLVQLASYHLALEQTGIVVAVARTEVAGTVGVGTEVGQSSVKA
jgi:hypothetical protein